MPEASKNSDLDKNALAVLENTSSISDTADLEKRVEIINHSKDVRAAIEMTLVLNEIIARIKQELPQDQDDAQVWRNINLLQKIEEIKDKLLAPTYTIDKKIQKLNLEICLKITAVLLAMLFAETLSLSALNLLFVILAAAVTNIFLIQHYWTKREVLHVERQHLIDIIRSNSLPTQAEKFLKK